MMMMIIINTPVFSLP